MKQQVNTAHAPQAIGPYSQAIIYGDIVYISGQIPLEPKTGILVEGGIVQQTEQVFKNIQAILTELNLTFSNVLKTTIFITEMKNFSQVNEVYAKYFEGTIFPARSTIAISELPKGALVEIECVVHK